MPPSPTRSTSPISAGDPPIGRAGSLDREPSNLRRASVVRAVEGRKITRAAVASLSVHLLAVIGLISVRPFSLPLPPSEPDILRVTLVPLAAPEPLPLEPEPFEAEAEPVEPEAPRAPDPTPDSVVEARPEASTEPKDTAAPPREPRIDLERLRRQLADLELDAEDESVSTAGPPGAGTRSDAVPWSERGEAIRGLPLGGGWLNPYVGPVQPVSETWGSQIGEQRGYHVLANGQAVCTRTPAPSFSELIHPWKAMRVTLAWDCGRARGTAPPPDDLDYAPAPAALREAADRTRGAGTAVP